MILGSMNLLLQEKTLKENLKKFFLGFYRCALLHLQNFVDDETQQAQSDCAINRG